MAAFFCLKLYNSRVIKCAIINSNNKYGVIMVNIKAIARSDPTIAYFLSIIIQS